MFTDNVLTLHSAWCLDNILLKDVSPDTWKCSPERNGDSDFYSVEDAAVDRIKQFHDYCGFTHTSTGTSIASSECGDDLYLDLDGDTEVDLFGDLASSVLNIIQDIQETGTEEIGLFPDTTHSVVSTLCDNCDTRSDPAVSLPCDNCDTRLDPAFSLPCDKCDRLSLKNSALSVITDVSCGEEEESCIDVSCTGCSSRRSRHRKNKKWNDLNEAEKVTVVDQLSQRISQDLGLREQLEVIRMIDPKSHASPTDEQFLIDITNMTEEKIEKIQDYIKTHCCLECQSDDSLHSSPRKSKKRQMSTERKNRHRHDRQRQRKEYRQILKERRSGLFVKEEVLSMSRLTPPPEEEDIDIIG